MFLADSGIRVWLVHAEAFGLQPIEDDADNGFDRQVGTVDYVRVVWDGRAGERVVDALIRASV